MLRIKLRLLILLILTISACKFDYEKTMIADDLEEKIPNTIIKNFNQTMVRDSRPKFKVEAKEASDFEKRKETVFKEVHFVEFDKEGNIITEGTSENGKLFTETENVELWGNLDFFSKSEEASLKGKYLFWDNENSVLEGNTEDIITIEKETGTSITGKGFYADSKTKAISFSMGVTGTWVNE